MKNRSLVMLAHNFTKTKHAICGMFCSEKLDGQRALWLPETRGLPIEEVGWANVARDTRAHTCTGLWSRYGKVIHAPVWFTGQLPEIPLDGELWLGRNKFQELMSVVKQLIPDERWKDVKYKVFDCPPYERIYQEGRIYSPNFKMTFLGGIPEINPHPHYKDIIGNFERVYYRLKRYFPALDVHEQTFLPCRLKEAQAKLDTMLADVIANGGEGIMLRNPTSTWEPIRTHGLVKMKPYHDDEATVIGYTDGEGKYQGMMGALVVRWSDKTFNLSGVTDAQRVNKIALGETVTFRYRELTIDGYPKEARFLRVKEEQ